MVRLPFVIQPAQIALRGFVGDIGVILGALLGTTGLFGGSSSERLGSTTGSLERPSGAVGTTGPGGSSGVA